VSGRLRYIVPVAVFAVIAAILGYMLLELKDGRRDPRYVPSPLVGQSAPQFALAGPEGIDTSLSRADLDGRITVVNIFASWCVPCLAEHPIMTRLGADPRVQLAGINYRDAPSDARGWLAQHGNPYDRIGADRDGRVGLDWGITGVPETFIVGPDGVIRYHHRGPVTPQILEEQILPAIAEIAG
jgi:cytochrome c biogenesis protein CcmG/thiol:disulfide interchange protein DsbE